MKKRMMPFLLAAFLVCVLAGCASKDLRPYSVMADETTFTVNPESGKTEIAVAAGSVLNTGRYQVDF